MLKPKLQYFGHLMQRVDSLEKTLMQVGNQVLSYDENFLCYVKLMKTRYLKVGNVRRRLSVSDGKIPTSVYL